MEFPRASMYQANITNYFQRRPPDTSIAVHVTPAFAQPSGDGPPVMYYAPGAGKQSAPIDVDEWVASEPIDVDEFNGTVAGLDPTGEPSVDYASFTGDADTQARFDLPAMASATVPDAVTASLDDDGRLFECCICADTFLHPVVFRTLCMHLYCDSCIRRNFEQSFSCPQCRGAITTQPMRDLLFEQELQRAIDEGVVEEPGARGRRAPYYWGDVVFPSS
ncbi:hypothetical protein C8R44DRAFT_727030 [Mycena epipterygia]|nr:hypothetical protein C8R44DRAFT_727030 [Mycena epipterygia]